MGSIINPSKQSIYLEMCLDYMFNINSQGIKLKYIQSFITLSFIQSYIRMNPDRTSDIRLVDRFIFESSLYLLTMFSKKIDTFTPQSLKHKITKNKEKQSLANKKAIDPSDYLQDPIKNLAKDKTKPIWDCVTTFSPLVLYNEPRQEQNNYGLKSIVELMKLFFYRFKNEHEDDGNLRITLSPLNMKTQILINSQNQDSKTSISGGVGTTIQELFQILIRYSKFHRDRINGEIEFERIQDQKNSEMIFYDAAIQMFEGMGSEQIHLSEPRMELQTFCSTVIKHLMRSLDSQIGPILLGMQPKISFIPLLIHPLLISLHSLIKIQLTEFNKKQKQKMQKKYPNQIFENQTENYGPKSCIFNEIKSEPCSKFVFLNFDGYESQYNLDLAKYLYKNLMYVSFPCQSSLKNLDAKLIEALYLKSERLIRKYFYSGLSKEEKETLLELYRDADKQIKKNMYIFPLFNRFLSQNIGLPGIQSFSSAFITFIMKQLIYNQILEYNPSCIIVSYSGSLSISNEQFTEIMKQITVLGNYKVIFFPNLSKNYLFDEPLSPDMRESCSYLKQENQMFEACQSKMKMLAPTNQKEPIKTDIFQKMSIHLKVSSGTYNLSKLQEVQSYVQKFKNFKVMAYTSELMKAISDENHNLNKMKMRMVQYSTVIKVLANAYKNKNETYDKLFDKVLTKYHKSLFKHVEGLLFGKQQTLADQQWNRMKASINHMWEAQQKKQKWQHLKFQQALSISNQKTQTHVFVHIPRFIKSKNMRKTADNILCLQFEIFLQKQKISSIEIAPVTSLYYDEKRKHQNCLIYMINHLVKPSSNQYQSFCGIITPAFDTKVQPKVQLKPVTFENIEPLPFYQTYTEFNYCQTQNYIFLFWPKVYDSAKYLLFQLEGSKYIPQSTSLIFRAKRQFPRFFSPIKPNNLQSTDIIPRHSCTCYEVEGTQSIYIFGGFYSDHKNHLKFQTDITRLTYIQADNSMEDPLISIANIPKEFYFEAEPFCDGRQTKTIVTKMKNQFIRPRIQYEIIGHQKNQFSETIFLVGGVGQNFVRPYSFIAHMAHRVVFCLQTGKLLSIERIPMNTVIPVNVKEAVKTRCPLDVGLVINAQNRSINLVEGKISSNGEIISRNEIAYNEKEQKFDFIKAYEFGEIDYRAYREEISYLKKITIDTQNRLNVTAQTHRGKQFNSNSITLVTENDKRYIFELQLQLSLDVRNLNPQLPQVVRLTGASLISTDISGTCIFGLIRHPSFTLDQCILAMFDLKDLTNKLAESKNTEIQLKQIHKFDENLSQNIIIAGNSYTIAIIHGQKFEPDAAISQILLVRTKKHQIKTFKISPSAPIESDQNLLKRIPGGINISLFLNNNDGNILCFSFKTLEKAKGNQIVYVVIQKLDMKSDQDKYSWEKIFVKKYSIIFKSAIQFRKKEPLRLLEIKPSKKDQNNQILQRQYDLIGTLQDRCVHGLINFSSNSQEIHLQEQGKSANQYFDELQKGSSKNTSISLDKHSNLYNELSNKWLIDE